MILIILICSEHSSFKMFVKFNDFKCFFNTAYYLENEKFKMVDININ